MKLNQKFSLKFKYFILLFVITLSSVAFTQKCSCGATGTNLCSPQYYATQTAAETDASTGVPAATITLSSQHLRTDNGQTHKLCYEYTTTSTETKIGLRFYVGTPQNCTETRVISISPTCGGVSLTPTTTTAKGFNEYVVTPSTKYNICVSLTFDPNDTGCDEVDPSKPAEIQYVELYMYNAGTSTPPSGCSSTIGTVAVTGATAKGGNEYDLNDGSTITITSSSSVMPTNKHLMSYAFFNCDPGTLTANQLLDLNNHTCYIGSDNKISTNDINTGGSSSSLTGESVLWVVPYTRYPDASGGTKAIVNDGTGCYAIGSAIKINYLTTPCGTCSTPTCPVKQVSEYALRNYTTDCNTLSSDIKNTTYLSYHTVTTDVNGAVGLVQGLDIAPNPCPGLQRSAVLKSATNTCSAVDIPPSKANANSTPSGFNPEWYNLTPSLNYIAVVTTIIPAGCNYGEGCLNAYGISNPPPPPICKTVDFEVQKAGVKVTNFNFTCSDNIVDLVALDPPDITLPEQWIYPGFILYIKPQSGTTWASVNKIDLIFNGVSSGQPADVLADLQNASLTNTDPYIFPVPFAQPGTFAFEIIGLATNSTKKFDYILFNAADGTIADQGTLDKTKKVTLTKNPVGTAHFSGPGVTDDPNNGGKGFFDPKVAGTGTHTITYTWDNGTNGAIHCTGTKTLSVTVTGGPTISTTPIEVCKGITTSTIPFTSTGSPTQYILTWDATAKSAGFSDITTYTTLSVSPLSINIPALAAINTYNGTLTVKDAGGCITTSPISVKIKDCCTASVGTIAVSGATLITIGEYDLNPNSTISISSTNAIMPSPTHVMSYAFFNCDPGTLTAPQLLDLNNQTCYLGSDNATTTTDDNKGGKSLSLVSLGNFSTVWVIPYTRFPDSNAGGTKAIVDDGTNCYAIGSAIKINYIKIPCGTCATPNCPIGSVPNYKDRLPATATCNPGPITTCPGQGETVCNTGVNFTDIEITYQTVVADAKGKLGAYIQGADYSGSTGFTITSRLFSQANCGVIPIPTSLFGTGNGTTTPTNDNVYGRGPTNGSWNPEWSGLTPNGTYILETTFNLGTEILKSYCMDFYGSTNCPAKIGTISVTGTGVTPKGINEYDVDPGSTITITSTNYVLPTPTSHVYSYAFFWCDPGTLTAAELLNLKDQPCYIASDNNITISDVNNAGESTSIPGEKVLWVVPFTRLPDTSSPPKVIVNDGTDCYAIGSPIKITYLKPPCGTCATPNCPIGSVPTYRDRLPASATCTPTTANSYTSCPGQGGTICNTGVNFTGTEISYQTVIADAKGKLGAYIQGADFTGTSGYTVTSRLFATGNCGVAAIPTSLFGSGNGTVTPTNNNVYGRGPTNGSWNPEWTGLTPNGTYILETTFNLGTEILRTYCMDYYGSPTCPEIKNPIPAFSFCSGATPTNSLEVESPNKVKYFYSTTKLTDASGNLNSGVNLYSLATVSNTLGTSTTAGTKEKLILTSTSFPTNISSSSVDYYVYAIFNDITLLDVSCRDFEEIKVTVNTLPVLKINNPATVCIPLTVDITNPLITLGSTGNGILSYYSDASNISVLANPSKIAVAGTYYIKSSNGSCSDSKPVTVTFITSPSLIVTNPAEVCQPATIDITDPKLISGNSTGAVITYCSNSAGTTLLTSPNSIRNSGTYYVKSTEFGCSTIMPIIVKVNPKPKANFVPTPPNVTTINSKSIMLNTSLNAVEYSWIFSDGLVSSDVSPEHNFPNKEQSKQVIILIATSDAGCMDTTSKIINVNEEVIYYIPNSFTPDGDDFNQVFKPVFTSGFDPFTYHLSIFNRWGELVFESNDTEVGWAGLYGKDGVLVQEGSFTWKIDFKLKENDARKILVGNVNILK